MRQVLRDGEPGPKIMRVKPVSGSRPGVTMMSRRDSLFMSAYIRLPIVADVSPSTSPKSW